MDDLQALLLGRLPEEGPLLVAALLEDRPLGSDSSVAVARSPYEALFLRAKPPEAFYSELTRRLGLVYNLTPPGA